MNCQNKYGEAADQKFVSPVTTSGLTESLKATEYLNLYDSFHKGLSFLKDLYEKEEVLFEL